MSFPRKAGAATKTYLRKAYKALTSGHTEFGLDNHLGRRAGHRILVIPDLDVTDDIEVGCGFVK